MSGTLLGYALLHIMIRSDETWQMRKHTEKSVNRVSFSPLRVYKERTKLKNYYLLDRDSLCMTTCLTLCLLGS